MTQRSVLTTQTKLTVQALKLGARRNTSECSAKSAILGALAATHILVRCPGTIDVHRLAYFMKVGVRFLSCQFAPERSGDEHVKF